MTLYAFKMPKIIFFFLGFASFIVGGGVLPSASGAHEVTDVVMISPGKDIQCAVDAHVPGTNYLLLSGVHSHEMCIGPGVRR